MFLLFLFNIHFRSKHSLTSHLYITRTWKKLSRKQKKLLLHQFYCKRKYQKYQFWDIKTILPNKTITLIEKTSQNA